MRRFLQLSLYTLGLTALAALELGLISTWPHPFNKVNIFAAVIVLLFMVKDSGSVVWIAAFVHWLIELYAVTPFGIVLFSGTITTLLVYWFYRSIVTNRTWLAALLLSVAWLASYRALYALMVLVFVGPDSALLTRGVLGSVVGIEIILTVILTLGLFGFLKLVSPRLNVTMLDT